MRSLTSTKFWRTGCHSPMKPGIPSADACYVDTRTRDFNGCSRRLTQLIIPDHDID
jgi:hypothetical protein